MYTKKLTYNLFNGETVTEVFQFNLTEEELYRKESGASSIQEKIHEIIGLSNPDEIKNMNGAEMSGKNRLRMLELFREFMDMSYGVLSADGRFFDKSPENLHRFQSTQAYSDLFMLFASNAEEAANFVNGIMPDKLRDAAEAYLADNNT